ncbi:hypothetical protein V2A60_007193 [Cordyceps javanica]|uniref:BolA-like protein n=1 Tax=Cordyceps javanica TaxID=43265 RepID=A0A545VR98_9HYPO|nr:BolA-like protein [Cordyceps javanica]TQW04252.1 BolA-like protein [Cordyceps javanica]
MGSRLNMMQPSLLCAACRRAAALSAPRVLLTTTTAAAPRRLSSTTARQQALLRPTSTYYSRQPSSRLRRLYSSSSSSPAAQEEETPSMSDAEAAIARLLVDKLAPSAVLVQDVSGGCGSMYAIEISAEAFRGQTILKQQRMVNAALGDVVKTWHGVQIRTSVPDDA